MGKVADSIKGNIEIFEENQTVLDYLKVSRLFGHLPDNLLQKLVPLSEVRKYPKGTIILEEGQKNDKVFFLIRGEVSLCVADELILTLRRIGDLFGEMSIINEKPCLTSIISETHVDVFVLHAGEIGKYSNLNSREVHNILYPLFAKVLTEKLFLTTHKAKEYEKSNRRLLDAEHNLSQLKSDLEARVVLRTLELKKSNSLLQTEIKKHEQTEEQLLKSNEELRVVNQQLQSTQSQLIQSAKLSSLGEMATGVAHELNQPLFSISLTTDNLIEDIEEGNISHAIPRLEKILQMVDRSSKIINHMRIFGRDANTIQYNKIDINHVIEASFILLNERLRLSSIAIMKDLADNIPFINCNQIQIEQVLTNILVNAKYALKSSNKKEIHIRSYTKDGWVQVEIEDTGCGISEDILPKIFDPFFTTKLEGQGTGLGLSISYGIIQDHKGELEVKSKIGEGSVFLIRFPID